MSESVQCAECHQVLGALLRVREEMLCVQCIARMRGVYLAAQEANGALKVSDVLDRPKKLVAWEKAQMAERTANKVCFGCDGRRGAVTSVTKTGRWICDACAKGIRMAGLEVYPLSECCVDCRKHPVAYRFPDGTGLCEACGTAPAEPVVGEDSLQGECPGADFAAAPLRAPMFSEREAGARWGEHMHPEFAAKLATQVDASRREDDKCVSAALQTARLMRGDGTLVDRLTHERVLRARLLEQLARAGVVTLVLPYCELLDALWKELCDGDRVRGVPAETAKGV